MRPNSENDKPAVLYYFHDPMCSWCYAFRHSLEEIVQSLPQHISLQKIVAGLAPDSFEPMPLATQAYVQKNWQNIEQRVRNTQFNYDFWTQCKPIRSTYPACRAVLSAKKQDASKEDQMLKAIQNGYYQQAKNPSLLATLHAFAEEIQLDVEMFKQDLISPEIEQQLVDEIQFSRSIGIRSFPSLTLFTQNQYLPLTIDYNNTEAVIALLKEY